MDQLVNYSIQDRVRVMFGLAGEVTDNFLTLYEQPRKFPNITLEFTDVEWKESLSLMRKIEFANTARMMERWR